MRFERFHAINHALSLLEAERRQIEMTCDIGDRRGASMSEVGFNGFCWACHKDFVEGDEVEFKLFGPLSGGHLPITHFRLIHTVCGQAHAQEARRIKQQHKTVAEPQPTVAEPQPPAARVEWIVETHADEAALQWWLNFRQWTAEAQGRAMHIAQLIASPGGFTVVVCEHPR